MEQMLVTDEIGITASGMTRHEMIEALEERIAGLRLRAQREWSWDLDEEIGDWEGVAARQYGALTGVTDDVPRTVPAIAAHICCLDAGDFLRYLRRFPPDAVVGISNHASDCVLHRYLAQRFGLHSDALSVHLDSVSLHMPQTVEAYDVPDDHVYWGDVRRVCEVALPAWAARIAQITSVGWYEAKRQITAGELRALLLRK